MTTEENDQFLMSMENVLMILNHYRAAPFSTKVSAFWSFFVFFRLLFAHFCPTI